jgi:hypothetical protein
MAAAAIPAWVAYSAAAAAVIGAGISAYGEHQAGEARHAAAKANADIAELQAQQARDQAVMERRRAFVEAENFAREARRRQGVRISAISASGITLSGSAADVLMDSALEDAQTRASIIHEGEQRAHARLVGASIEEMSSAEALRHAAAERQAGRTRAAATIIGSFGQTGFQVSQSPAFRRVGGGTV